MSQINIFTTAAVEGIGDPFRHDGITFAIDRIGADGLRRLLDGPTFIFVDWLLPEMSGLELCRQLRSDARLADAHVTMILEQDDPQAQRQALRSGADDYIVGPVDRRRLLDRVMALQPTETGLRRRRSIDRGGLVIDLDAMQARWRNRPLRLAQNEFRLLRFLAENPNRVLSRTDIIEGLGKRDLRIQERAVDVWMKRLRAALGDVGNAEALRTVKGMGYVLDLR